MEAVDYKRIAAVVSSITLISLRQDMMQKFADMFLQHEPRFDLVTFANECGCSTVDVPVSYLREGDEIKKVTLYCGDRDASLR